MLAKKNRVGNFWVFSLTFAVFIAGCTPPGPRALLDGKRLLEKGRYSEAVERLKTATSLMTTNAQAWNYLGLALHHSGEVSGATNAYQRAITLNRDLVEARFNRGCLWLEQNKLDAAREDFTAYTMRQPNAPEGWLKLGAAQLRARDVPAAEKCFQEALQVSPKNPDALNSLGLAQLQRRHPREAAQYFASALKVQPDFRPALLNLATVSHQYLNDTTGALQKYREYLALRPRPDDYDAVNAIIQDLEQSTTPRKSPAPVETVTAPPPAANVTKTQAAANPRPPAQTRIENPPATGKTTLSAAKSEIEVVNLKPEPVIVTAPVNSTTATSSSANTDSVVTLQVEPAPAQPEKGSFLKKLNPINWFRSEPKPAPAPTPLPPVAKVEPTPAPAPKPVLQSKPKPESEPEPAPKPAPQPAPPKPEPAPEPAPKPVVAVAEPSESTTTSPAPTAFSHYKYLSPKKPSSGKRREAERAFTQGAQAHQSGQLADALKSYQQAVKLDPSYFEAYYNLGLTAYALQSYSQALSVWEYALAIRPDSSDARYNFALTLKAANYPLDAARELETILADSPSDVRAHLLLGNLYVNPLRRANRARVHYVKVLELDPQNAQAAAIRYWLVANPK